MGGAGGDVDLVVAGAWEGLKSVFFYTCVYVYLICCLTVVAQKLEALGKGVQQLAVDSASDVCGIKRPVCYGDAVQGAGLALGDEVLPVGGCWLDDFRNVGDGGPCDVGAGRRLVVSCDIRGI